MYCDADEKCGENRPELELIHIVENPDYHRSEIRAGKNLDRSGDQCSEKDKLLKNTNKFSYSFQS